MKCLRRIMLSLVRPDLVYRRLRYGSSKLSVIELREIEPYLFLQGSIVEAGASDGIDTLALSKTFSSQSIFAVEPILEQYIHLQQIFKNSSNVFLSNLALSSQRGFAEMNVGSDGKGDLGGMGSSSLLNPTVHTTEFPQIQFKRRQNVQTITLQDFAHDNGINFIDLLWLDLQGLELSVIKASSDWIKKHVNCVHLELCRVPLYQDAPNSKEVEKFMKSIGFSKFIDRVGITSGNALFVNGGLRRARN